ncbi:dihydroxyacetone kinase subunit DhaL [Methylobacter sp. BlB1]|jgi:dihydroxyacetone kinase-like protein|uniref:dihydroxyacetone kinase subunit DhaL n=1 Tax=unclassified Methylobacter TaxID=2635283 RepID=UPI0018956CDC|nr:dihydroxyacetone kinase subunit DhaL [Methylobacter sp. BlB1]MBF6647443.1 dihydroxyacetone kinase subunit L [Methylobacter sp. BlB1]
MQLTPQLLPDLIQVIADAIENNAEEVTALDQAIGDGDHVFNLQRGIQALKAQSAELGQMDWAAAWQKIGMTLMTTIGGASGSLYGTLFMAMSKAARDRSLDLRAFAEVYAQGVEAVKQRGKADVGEKTMLDVLVPVADSLLQSSAEAVELPVALGKLTDVALAGMESTRDMVATKGRASFLEERSRGHIDAGAKTAQLMICAIVALLVERLAAPT